MDNAREGITISDATLPDNPLIYVNKGFIKMTGYSFEEAINKNCRYLQGIDSDAAVITATRNAVRNRTVIQVELINYRKNGEAFWNYLSITPIFNDEKELTHFIGVQDDITELKKKRLLEQQIEAEKLVAKTMLKAEKKERHRVGMELHDNISQLLGSVKLYLRMVEKDPVRTELLKTSIGILDNAIGEVRGLSRKLVSPGLDENDLVFILSKLIETTGAVVNFNLEFTAEGFIPELLSETEQLVIFRVVQEQLNNTIKYAYATKVRIDLFTLDNTCKLQISDNGVGFNTQTVHAGIGLSNIKARVAAVKGKMSLTSAPGKGTELIVEIKLDRIAEL